MIYCVNQLTKSFGNHTALRNLCVEISEPGIYGILGPNGAGKSTFIKLMLKILTPSSGNIYYSGKNIEHAGNDYFRDIGAVLEGNRNLYWYMSAKENLRYYGRLMGLADNVIRNRTEELLSVMDLQGHENKKVGYCSRGMQQKVALMTALIHSPKILFLDEPTLGLDLTTKLSVISEIQKMSEQGTTVFLTTHQIDVLERLTNKLIILENGVATYQGSIDALVNAHKGQQRTEYTLPYTKETVETLASLMPSEAIRIHEERKQIHLSLSESEEAFAYSLVQMCAEKQIRIIAVTPETPTLEEVLISFWRNHHG